MIKHFLSLSSFSPPELLSLLDRAQYFSQHFRDPDKISFKLKYKILANLFYEPSTRTRCSFEVAAKKLGADVINFVPENSSVKKGETIYDTLKSIESLGVDALTLRHSDDHIFDELKDKIKIPILNAGAGKQEHPSQGMLDLLTLKQEFQKLEGLKIVVCGDIKHSRVAGSLRVAAEKFGMELYFSGPESLIPSEIKSSKKYVNFDQILPEVDAVMMLRIQLERHTDLELDANSYNREYGLTLDRANKLKEKSIFLHPGPFNRDVEIAGEIIEHPKSRIFKQMNNGVFTRMAILEWAMKEAEL